MAISARLFCFLGVALFYTTRAQPAANTPTPAPTPAPEPPAPTVAKVVDEYLIILRTKSGGEVERNWTLPADKVKDFQAALNGLFDHASHGGHGGAMEVAGELSSALGYKGMEIRHYENAALRHTILIHKCKNRNLQWRLIDRTSPAGLIPAEIRRNIYYALKGCKRSVDTHSHGGHNH